MIEKNDWRLMGQEDYLMGVTLWKKKYTRYSETWDHDHCDFCGVTFSEFDGDLHEGYATEGDGKWICPECFEDFKEMFHWKVINITRERQSDGSA